MKEIKSIIVWPKEKDGGPHLGWHESVDNTSEDKHSSILEAENVCVKLMRKGFGLDGHVNGIYPISARVEVDGKEFTSWHRNNS